MIDRYDAESDEVPYVIIWDKCGEGDWCKWEDVEKSLKAAFWNAFERAHMNPDDTDIQSNWLDYVQLQEKNKKVMQNR